MVDGGEYDDSWVLTTLTVHPYPPPPTHGPEIIPVSHPPASEEDRG